MPHITISDQLIDAINGSGKSLREISRETGITTSTISRFVSGERTINDQILSELCWYFDLELKPCEQTRKRDV